MEVPPQTSADAVVVARVNRAHGRDGGISVELLSDLPGRFDAGRELLVDAVPHIIAASRQTGPSSALLWLTGITTRGAAAPLAGKFLTARPQDDLDLDEGEYYHYQLIGMQVVTEEGEHLGELQEILETGSNDVYIVRGDSGELLIPAMASVVREVNVPKARMTVSLPDGLR